MFSMRSVSFYILMALFVAALSSGIAILVVQSRSGSPGVEILLPTATIVPTATPAPDIPDTPAPPDLPDLKVHISGAVAMPGVYAMEEGDRLEDAIKAAGGATYSPLPPCMNLAVRVKDEASYNVPGSGEPCQQPVLPATTATEEGGDARIEATAEPDADPGIDLNTATLEQLITLPGIGPVKAQAIVDYREGTGQFQSIEEVTEVRGIGPATYEGIRDLIRVGKAPP